MSNKLTIAISGKSGCGNTTVSNMLARKLNLTLINYTFHDMAGELGVAFETIMQEAKTDSRYDLALDKKQMQLAKSGNCVLGSRLAVWLLVNAQVKVFLEGSLSVRAKRIARRENKDMQIALRETEERDRKDHDRFYKLYGIDNNKYDFVDLIVDTERGDQYYVTDTIAAYIRHHGLIPQKSR
jgi:cytidylate kinase